MNVKDYLLTISVTLLLILGKFEKRGDSHGAAPWHVISTNAEHFVVLRLNSGFQRFVGNIRV